MKWALDDGDPLERNPFAEPSGIDRVVTLQPGQSYRVITDVLFVTNGAKPGIHKLEVRLESDGKYLEVDKNTGQMISRQCWAGRIESKPLSVIIRELDNADDREALKVLTQDKDLSSVWLYSDAVLSVADKRYQTVLDKYPKSVFAKQCEMLLARAYARRFDEAGTRFDEAVRHYTNVIDNYPAFTFTDDAMLELARVYMRKDSIDSGKGYREKSIEHLQHLIKTYPKSDSAPAAKELLAVVEKTSTTRPKDPETKPKEG